MDDDQPNTVLIQIEISDDDTSNQQSQDMSETTNQEPPDSPEQYNHPCLDLLDEGRRRDYIDICVPLYRASLVGDWEAVEEILSINGEFRADLLGYAITEDDNDTLLHLAVYSQSIKFVENIVNRMTDEQLVLQDNDGQTALHRVAAVGNVDMARVMVERCPQMLTIRDSDDDLPIYMAAFNGKHNMVAYLYGEYKSMEGNDWRDQDIYTVFLQCIEADLFGTFLVSL
ncbi:hypothetical protein OSB04_014023 [Centaurea solstitialis]|uniref:Uncharacterized protein n=1 Tax=Centaurea solstitialis TaxID=347529 RepID=A0AA38TED6_9ASTR|nr:hypothetical protein OSB04_014023 [Centaurea solstitialis]